MIAEDERRSAEIFKSLAEGGWKMDAVWADDFHHATRKYFTGEMQEPVGRYAGSLDELADILQHGWLYRGEPDARKIKPHSTVCDHLAPEQFTYYISNHDQVGNRPYGDRLHEIISPEAYRALSLFFCLIPYTPMLFMGQEWAADSPFLYFTDHPGTSGALVSAGRIREFNFDGQTQARPIPDCQAESTFQNSKLKWNELERRPHDNILALYREALQLRKRFFGRINPPRNTWKISATSDRLTILYNLGSQNLQKLEVSLQISPGPEVGEHQSDVILRSNDPRFCEHSSENVPETTIRLIASR
jgi:maltooligosyltrehalose trehalohydrolase